MASVITEAPSGPGLVQEAGKITVAREFNIVGAGSKVEALLDLAAFGITTGTIYVDARGNVPSLLLRAKRITINPAGREVIGDNGDWSGIVGYESIDITKEDEELEVDGPARWSVEDSIEEEGVDHDRKGKPVLNSAKLPFSDPISTPVPKEVLVAEWIKSGQSFFDALKFARTFRGMTNSRTFKGAPVRSLFVVSFIIQALEVAAFTSRGIVKFIIKLEQKNSKKVNDKTVPGWTRSIADMGRNKLNTGVNRDTVPHLAIKVRDEKTNKDVKVTQDVPLDGKGQPAVDQKSLFGLSFELIDEVNLNALRI